MAEVHYTPEGEEDTVRIGVCLPTEILQIILPNVRLDAMSSQLPPQAEQYLDSVVAGGFFPSKEAALEAAIVALREKMEPIPFVPDEDMESVEQAIRSANAGESREMTPEDWEALRQLARDVAARGNG